ncbi:hypothetical protein TNCV_2885871 [Trichonephila clavipes]|nr:hypothetical protein TNCV_2885871 [Trichonephila clavipes]
MGHAFAEQHFSNFEEIGEGLDECETSGCGDLKVGEYSSSQFIYIKKWHLRFDIFKIQETKLPLRLINTTDERRLVQGHETPLREKRDIEDFSSEIDNGRLKVGLLGRNA